METIDLLIKNANELITLSKGKHPHVKGEMNNLSIIQNGSIAVHHGEIIDVGKNIQYRAEQTIDATGKTVMPGFIDSHTHLVFAGSREFELDMKLHGMSYLEILNQGGGILYTVKATRKADKEELKEQAMKRLDTMLSYGTTTCEAKSGYGLNVETELKILEAIRDLQKMHMVDVVPTFLGAHAVPEEYSGKTDDYVDLVINDMIPRVAQMRLACFCDVFCEEGVFTVDQSKRILEAGLRYGLQSKVHADEIVNTGGASLAAQLKATSADHLSMSSDDGIKKMIENSVMGVLLPGTPFSLMSDKYADARKMIKMGLPVALATDLNPNCWTENMQFVMQLACLKMRMTPAEAVTATTINAAYAIGESERIGSLETGKQADIVVLGCSSHKFIPYHFGVNLVEKVIKKGKVVV